VWACWFYCAPPATSTHPPNNKILYKPLLEAPSGVEWTEQNRQTDERTEGRRNGRTTAKQYIMRRLVTTTFSPSKHHWPISGCIEVVTPPRATHNTWLANGYTAAAAAAAADAMTSRPRDELFHRQSHHSYSRSHYKLTYLLCSCSAQCLCF